MTKPTIPAFTADELKYGTPISTVEEIAALGPGSVIALVEDGFGFVSADIYVNWVGRWTPEDPEHEGGYQHDFDAESMHVIANQRDHRQVIVLIRDGDYSKAKPVTSVEDLAEAKHGATVFFVNKNGSIEKPWRNFGGWITEGDDHVYTKDELVSYLRHYSGAYLVWDAPASKTR